MRAIHFSTYTQYSFWGNVEFPTNKEAMLARNALARQLEQKGYKVRKHSLTDQMRKYDGLGQYNGTIGTVYYVDAIPTENAKELFPKISLTSVSY